MSVPSEDQKSNEPGISKEKKSLGKVVASRATDLIAIAIIIVAALTVGSKLTKWWSVDEAELKSPLEGLSGSTQWGENGQPVLIQFGDSKTPFQRTDITGTSDELTSKLVELTISKTKAARPESVEPSEAESKIVKYLSKSTPFKSVSLEEEVYLIGGPAPVVWGIKKQPDSQPRVVCWGTCLSKGENRWTFYLSSFGNIKESENEFSLRLTKPIQIVLSLQNEDGGSMINFTSDKPIEVSRKHLQSDLESQGWKMLRDWSINSDDFLSTVFLKRLDDQKVIRADVQIKEQPNESCSGMVVTNVSKLPNEK